MLPGWRAGLDAGNHVSIRGRGDMAAGGEARYAIPDKWDGSESHPYLG